MKVPTADSSLLLLLSAILSIKLVVSQPANFLPQCLNLPATPLTQGWNLIPNIQGQDDANTISPVPLGFNFNFYGSVVTGLYASSNSWFSPVPPQSTLFQNFPLDNNTIPPIIAPLWADTTLFLNGATAFYTSIPVNRVFAFVFYRVGINGAFGRATWQVIVSDGFYAPMGIGNNICFCFQNVTWSGGTPTIGVSNGDGVHYAAPPIAPPDGVIALPNVKLTNTSFCFNTRLPVQCNNATAQFVLVNANPPYQDLEYLCNGSYFDYADRPLVSIRFIPVVPAGKAFNKVRFFANGVRTRDDDEFFPPYSIYGDPNATGHYRPWVVKPGPYVIQADVMQVTKVVTVTTLLLNIFDSTIKS